ncbi:MAG: protein translocase subunit SecF [Elusimicrobiota bacterium]
MIQLFKTVPQVDFMKRRKLFYGVSGAMVLGTLVFLAVKGPPLSIDFTGGALVEGRFQQRAELEDVRQALSDAGLQVEIQTEPARNAVIIRTGSGAKDEAATRITDALNKAFPSNSFTLERAEFVGPVVGRHLVRQSLLAVVFSLLGIILYVAFRFKNWIWGATGVLALFHDVVITTGFLAVTGREMSVTVIAALLTLAGYSINDTIVIFDRIRENIRLRRKEPLDVLINRSLNETLSRTMITSLMVLLVLLALVFFGGEVLRDFSAALTFGVIIGSYSTWFVATPMVYDWQMRRARRPR